MPQHNEEWRGQEAKEGEQRTSHRTRLTSSLPFKRCSSNYCLSATDTFQAKLQSPITHNGGRDSYGTCHLFFFSFSSKPPPHPQLESNGLQIGHRSQIGLGIPAPHYIFGQPKSFRQKRKTQCRLCEPTPKPRDLTSAAENETSSTPQPAFPFLDSDLLKTPSPLLHIRARTTVWKQREQASGHTSEQHCILHYKYVPRNEHRSLSLPLVKTLSSVTS